MGDGVPGGGGSDGWRARWWLGSGVWGRAGGARGLSRRLAPGGWGGGGGRLVAGAAVAGGRPAGVGKKYPRWEEMTPVFLLSEAPMEA